MRPRVGIRVQFDKLSGLPGWGCWVVVVSVLFMRWSQVRRFQELLRPIDNLSSIVHGHPRTLVAGHKVKGLGHLTG